MQYFICIIFDYFSFNIRWEDLTLHKVFTLLILSTQQSKPEEEKLCISFTAACTKQFPSVLFKIVHLYFILWINELINKGYLDSSPSTARRYDFL